MILAMLGTRNLGHSVAKETDYRPTSWSCFALSMYAFFEDSPSKCDAEDEVGIRGFKDFASRKVGCAVEIYSAYGHSRECEG